MWKIENFYFQQKQIVSGIRKYHIGLKNEVWVVGLNESIVASMPK